jgi:hypothetical protein
MSLLDRTATMVRGKAIASNTWSAATRRTGECLWALTLPTTTLPADVQSSQLHSINPSEISLP